MVAPMVSALVAAISIATLFNPGGLQTVQAIYLLLVLIAGYLPTLLLNGAGLQRG